MKKLALVIIVILSFAIPFLSYGSTEPEIPMPKMSADMFNWQDWDAEGITSALIILECNDKSTIWVINPSDSLYCMQVTFVLDDNIAQELDEMRSAPNCKCPPSSY